MVTCTCLLLQLHNEIFASWSPQCLIGLMNAQCLEAFEPLISVAT